MRMRMKERKLSTFMINCLWEKQDAFIFGWSDTKFTRNIRAEVLFDGLCRERFNRHNFYLFIYLF